MFILILSRHFEPVCGEDGKTYVNKCLARCNNTEPQCPVYKYLPGPCECDKLELDFNSKEDGKIKKIFTFLSNAFSKILNDLKQKYL